MDEVIKQISSDYIYPAGIFTVMFGLGLSLQVSDLAKAVTRPLPLLTGLGGQMIFLPLAAFAVASLPAWPAAVSVGLILIAVSPGGTVSNLLVFAIGGEVALSVAMTAISSILTLLTIPLLAGLALSVFGGPDTAISIPPERILRSLLVMTALPIAAGMILHRAAPAFSARLIPVMKRLSIALLVFIIALSLYNARGFFNAAIAPVLAASLLLSAIVVVGGFAAPALLGLDVSRRLTVSIEIGVQNVPLAIYLAASVLAWPELTVVAIVYTLSAYAMIGIIIGFSRLTGRSRTDGSAP